MNYQEIAEKNKILQFHCGSHLYGTNTLMSDKDLMGVFLPPIEAVIGFSHVDEVDCGNVSKDVNNKNLPDAVDLKMYEIRKYVRLAMDNNPNILETVFVPTDMITYINSIGKILLENKMLFPHKGLVQRFVGYAHGQKHKMNIKQDNYNRLQEALRYLTEKIQHSGSKRLLELNSELPHIFIQRLNTDSAVAHYSVGDLNLLPTLTVRRSLNVIEERLSKVGNREELFLKYGYDVKFGSHLIRLLLEAKELLTTGGLVFPLSYRHILLDIKNGAWKIQAVLDYAEELEADVDILKAKTDLPDRPAVDRIERMLMNVLRGVVVKDDYRG